MAMYKRSSEFKICEKNSQGIRKSAVKTLSKVTLKMDYTKVQSKFSVGRPYRVSSKSVTYFGHYYSEEMEGRARESNAAHQSCNRSFYWLSCSVSTCIS